jgi:hypothetical protein
MNIIRDAMSVELGSGEEHLINIPLETSQGKFVTPRDRLHARMNQEENKAAIKGLPFSRAGVMGEVEDLNRTAINQLKRQGYVNKDLNLNIDWSKYSDLKNFEVLSEGTQHDENLSNRHKLPIYIKWTKYRFIGTSEEITIMEPAETAVKRAQLELEVESVKRLHAVTEAVVKAREAKERK